MSCGERGRALAAAWNASVDASDGAARGLRASNAALRARAAELAERNEELVREFKAVDFLRRAAQGALRGARGALAPCGGFVGWQVDALAGVPWGVLIARWPLPHVTLNACARRREALRFRRAMEEAQARAGALAAERDALSARVAAAEAEAGGADAWARSR